LGRQRAALPRGVSEPLLAAVQHLLRRFSRRQDGFLTFGFLPFYLLQGFSLAFGLGLSRGERSIILRPRDPGFVSSRRLVYGYRAVAKTRVAYVAMKAGVIAGWFRE